MSVDLLKNCTLCASIDWLDVLITFARPTQFRYVQEAFETHTYLGKLYIKGVSENPNSCRTFRVRVHDPDPVRLIAATHRVSEKFDKICGCVLHAIEIAVDALPGEHTPLDRFELAQLAFALLRGLSDRHSDATDIITFRDWFEPVENKEQAVEQLAGGCSINTGRKGDSVRNRCYVKSIDHVNGNEFVHLTPRARLEVTLRGSSVLPVKTLEELLTFKFETLVPHFRQVKLAELPAHATVTQVADYREMQRGAQPLGSMVGHRADKKRASKFCTVRDQEVNGRITAALRTLTRRVANSVKKPMHTHADVKPVSKRSYTPSEGTSVITTKHTTEITLETPKSPNYVTNPPSSSNPAWGAW
ncbi:MULTISPECIES: hypothetical protein [unclassified Comamonas]|uniref:hypothetical protein n=1 Tax=unclassified Comamonas TaxID=2638500 RepID=UPI0006359CC3|nr:MULTISPECIES: hypothetical protein [unclassified Comamonas]UUC91576.1 hypothetical protein NOX35_14770 [Comamonas sp. C11]GAO72982.1 hypothetical protein CSE6_029_44190 [Comamonas sp. E6]